MKYRKKPVVIEAFKYDGDLKGADGKYYVPDWAIIAFENGIECVKSIRFVVIAQWKILHLAVVCLVSGFLMI